MVLKNRKFGFWEASLNLEIQGSGFVSIYLLSNNYYYVYNQVFNQKTYHNSIF